MSDFGSMHCHSETVAGAGFDNWIDAVDASFCTFEGGDDPEQVPYFQILAFDINSFLT